MSTEDDTIERLLEAVDRGAEPPGDTDDAVGSVLARLGIEGGRPVPQVPRAPAPPPREWQGPSWSLAAMLLLGIGLGVLAAFLALRPAVRDGGTDLAARGAGPGTVEASLANFDGGDDGSLVPPAPAEIADDAPPTADSAPPTADSAPAAADDPDIAPAASADSASANPVAVVEVSERRDGAARDSSPHRRGGSTAPDAVVERDDRVAVLDPTASAVGPGPSRSASSTEGLVRHGDAGMTIRGTTAILRNGLLTFVRNEEVHPTVDRVRFATVDATALPEGTVFTSAAAPGAGAVSVQEGVVFLLAADGRPLAGVRAGEAVLVVHDPTEGVVAVPLDGMPLDAIAARIPDGSEADPAQVRALVAELRLAPVSGEALQTLLEFGIGDLE